MRKRMIYNLTSLIVTLMLLITVSFAWWTGGIASNKVVIITANIASKLTTYEGLDFNYDGNLNKDKPFSDKSLETIKSETGDKTPNIKLEFKDIVPTKVYTWKVNVLNQGDAHGYVTASLSDDYELQNNKYIKYFSFRQQGGAKAYFADAIKKKEAGEEFYLFSANEKIDVSCDMDYIFQIQMENFEDLKALGHVTDNDYPDYQLLQGDTINFVLLGVSLQSSHPNPSTVAN